MLSFSTVHVLLVVVVFLLVTWAVTWLLKKDKTVDLWQEDVAEFAGILDKWQLPHLADIARSVSAINVTGAIRKIRELRRQIMNAEDRDGQMLKLLEASFMYQLPKRLSNIEGRQKIVEIILKSSETLEMIDSARDE